MLPWQRRAQILAFVTAFSALFVQVLVHRAVQLKLVNNYAFLVISLTMLGFAASGVVLSAWKPADASSRETWLLRWCGLFAATLLLAAAVYYHSEARAPWAHTRVEFIVIFLRLVPLALVFAVPFLFCGLILGTLLSAADLDVRRIYFADLVGSALGAWLVIPAISVVGVEGGMMLGAGLMIVGGLVLTAPPPGRRRSLLLAALPLLAALADPDRFFRMKYSPASVLALTQDPESGFVLERVLWDPVARIELTRRPPISPDTVPWPYLIGSRPAFHQRFVRMLTQNNNAFTYAVAYDGRPESLDGIEETLYAAAYQVKSAAPGRALVIGVGGGFDVLTALRFGTENVVGVEVNAATVALLTRLEKDYFQSWVGDPRFRLVHAEGRHFLAGDAGSYDVLQLSGVDSASGTPTAAHVFSESYIYTAEAFDVYLSRLAPDGVMNMMRQEYRPVREMLRALVTAVAALRRAGITRPADHILMLTSDDGLFTSLLMKKSPFTAEEEARVQAWAAGAPYFEMSAGPALNHEGANSYQKFLALDDPAKEAAAVARYPFDVRPATDDRPFFFKYSYWSHLVSDDPEVRASVPVMEVSLLLLLGVTSVALVACVFLPLRRFAAAGLGVPHAGRFGVFFAAIGLGYLFVEMALIQMLGVFLGHPNYGLSVVLAALLFSSGIGAIASTSLLAMARSLGRVGLVVAVLLLLLGLLVLPQLGSLVTLGMWQRVLVAIVVIAPLGLSLGVFFPTGIARLKGTNQTFVPWAWGLNGMFSVVAPILSVAVAVTWGSGALLLWAIPVYLLAGYVLPGGTTTEP